MISVKPLEAAGKPAWDAFVKAHPSGTFFHLAAWQHVIENSFDHRSHYLLTERAGTVTGVLPLFHVKTRMFGNSLMSIPFCVYGGPLAADGESMAALLAQAASLMREVGAPVLEFRFRDAASAREMEDLSDPTWQSRPDLYVTFRKPITEDDASNLKAIPRKQRAVVRKGIDSGLVSVVDDDVDRLHRVYAESVRNLGTPVFHRGYFRNLRATFHDQMDVLTVMDGATPLAAVMNFYWRDEVVPYYGGGTRAARAKFGNDFMYWEVMRRAAAKGCRLFDFGRSKIGTGAFAFKKNWGFVPEPLHYRFRLRAGATIPDHNPLNPKYRLFINAWKRLPLPVANLLGPHIVRGVG